MNERVSALLRQLGRRTPGDIKRCSICHVEGHNAQTCMFLKPAEWSPTRQAAHYADTEGLPDQRVAKTLGTNSQNMGVTRWRLVEARVSTLRAMTELIYQGISAVQRLEADGRR